nr:HAMP domain-containing sensor histidine kinase [Roseibium litorale]
MDRPLYLTGLSNVRETGKECRVELRLRYGAAQPGEAGLADYVWTALTIRPANGPDLAEGTLCLTLEDITGSRARDEELQLAFRNAQEASLQKTRFIASASHELRTPLNAIIGFSSMLRNGSAEGSSGPAGREYADLIHRSSLHLLQVVDEILDSSRLETGSVKLAIEPVDLADLVQSCAAMLKPEAEANGVLLVLPSLDGLPALAADKRALRQILINLVSNGIKFSPEGGKVALGIRREGALVVLSVSDEGEGIARDQIERIGQPFARLEGRNAASTPGCGLGLSIVKGLAALHGGSLKVESRPGKGTLAEVYLPAASRKTGSRGNGPIEQAGDNPAVKRKSA